MDYAIFQNADIKGFTATWAQDIHKRKGLKKSQLIRFALVVIFVTSSGAASAFAFSKEALRNSAFP